MHLPEEAAFWAKIAENPDDELTRLVFADWLDDRDDPRAAWMRDEELARYMGPGVESPLPALLAALQSEETDSDEEGSHPSLWLFARLGEPALAPLLDLCRGEARTSEMEKASQALARFDGDLLAPYVSEFIRLIPLVGSNACEALARIGPDAAPALPHILEGERDHHISGHTLAAFARAVGPAAEPAVPRLVELLCEHPYHGMEDHLPALVAVGPHTLSAVLDGMNRLDNERVCNYRSVFVPYGEAAVPTLTAVVNGPPSPGRTAALLSLARLAPAAAVPHLVDGLQNDSRNRIAFLESLKHMGPDAADAIPAIQQLLHQSESSELWEYAAEAIAEILGQAQVPALIEQLADEDPAVRLGSLRVLAQFARGNPQARAALIAALSDPHPEAKRFALGELGSICRDGDEDIVEPLRPLLADPDPLVRASAADVLAQVKSAAAPAVPELLVAMRDPVEAVRSAATRTVDGMQHEEPRMLGALLDALADESEEIRHVAAHGLQEWTRLYPEYSATVFARLTDPDPYIARAAATLMGKATEPTPELIAHFRNTIRTGEEVADRVIAATSLAKLKVTDPDVLDEVFAVFDETEAEEMAWPLVEIGDAAVPYLAQRLESVPSRRYDILSGFWWSRSDIDLTPLVGVAIGCLSDPEDLVRQQAAQLLQKIGKPVASVALPRLLKLFDDEYFGVRWQAVTAAATVAPVPVEVLDPLVRLYGRADHYLRKSIVEALSILEVPASTKLPHFLTALGDDDTEVVKRTLEAIAPLEKDARDAEPRLLELRKHENSEVRLKAVDALGKVSTSRAALAAIRNAMSDSDLYVREMAANRVVSFGEMANEAIPELTRLATTDPGDGVRRVAAIVLAEIGAAEVTAPVVGDVIQMLWSSDGEIRIRAARTLGYLGRVAAPAIPELARALRDPTWGDIRKETVKRYSLPGVWLLPREQVEAIGSFDQRFYLPHILQKIGTPDVYPVLAEALADPNPVIAVGAESALEELMPACKDFVRGLLDHPDEDIRRRAIGILNPSTSEEH